MVNLSQLKGYGVVACIFVLGVLAGGGGAYAFIQKRYAEVLGGGRVEWLERRRARVLEERLGLDGAAREQVRAIFGRYQDRRRELSSEMFERCGAPLRELDTQLNNDIRSVLNAEQQKTFEEIMARRREQLPFYREPRGRRGHSGSH